MNAHVEMLAAYFGLMNSNGASHVYRESLKAGILDALASGPKTPAEVAASCHTDPRATELVLETLAALGLVHDDGGRCSLSMLAVGLLGGSYRELGDPYWAHFPSFLKTGQPWIKMDDVAQSETHYQAQAAALAWMLGPTAEAAARALQIGQRLKNLAILDVGAGSAVWSLAMAKCDPGTKVTSVDWPAVLEVAIDNAASMGLADRLTTLAGNFHEVEFPESSFDVVILGNVTHLEIPEGNRELLLKAHRALKPLGRIVIFDVFPGRSEGDVNRTLYALGLALRTAAGRVYKPKELEALLAETGFGSAQLVNLDTPPYAVGMLIAERQG